MFVKDSHWCPIGPTGVLYVTLRFEPRYAPLGFEEDCQIFVAVVLRVYIHKCDWFHLLIKLVSCKLLLCWCVFIYSGTFGLVDYTNSEDMKYAVSYYLACVLICDFVLCNLLADSIMLYQIRKLDDTEFKNPWTRTFIRVSSKFEHCLCLAGFLYLQDTSFFVNGLVLAACSYSFCIL